MNGHDAKYSNIFWQGHKIMLEAVYIDLAASRSIVGIQPKPVFYPLFNFLENQTENTISVFHDKKIEPPSTVGSSTVMVETGESRTPRPVVTTCQDYSQSCWTS